MTLPPFLEVEILTDRIVLLLDLQFADAAFEGHFPAYPVLPGVVQLDWTMQLASRYFALEIPVAQDFQVKFKGIIKPGFVTLTLQYDRAIQRLSFDYSTDTYKFSSGQVRLKCAA
jgi:3-hydroxymyristoyl/3-hydroxydecanoyl-(acyl carrier protein) dehydratase